MKNKSFNSGVTNIYKYTSWGTHEKTLLLNLKINIIIHSSIPHKYNPHSKSLPYHH